MLGANANDESLARLRQQLGLDRPVLTRYFEWLGGLVQGDLGNSMATNTPVAATLVPRLLNSLVLTAIAAVATFAIAGAVGVYAGLRAGSRTDRTLSGASLFAAGVPDFVTGVILIFIFSFTFGLLPGTSLFPLSEGPEGNMTKLVLPALTLIIANVGYSARMIRAGVAETMNSEYVEFAVLNGLPQRTVIWRYSVRNALAPALQVSSLTLLFMLSGVIVVETLFQYPGIGQMAVQATIAQDFVTISSLSVAVAALYVFVNIVTDAAILALSPRSKTVKGATR